MGYLTNFYPTLVLLLECFWGKVRSNEFDFGLMENEPLLQELFKEDRRFLQEMYKINALLTLSDMALGRYAPAWGGWALCLFTQSLNNCFQTVYRSK